jgi:hypothetical protein
MALIQGWVARAGRSELMQGEKLHGLLEDGYQMKHTFFDGISTAGPMKRFLRR